MMNLRKMVKNFRVEIHSSSPRKIEPHRRSRFSYAKTEVREDDYITIITLRFCVVQVWKKTKHVG